MAKYCYHASHEQFTPGQLVAYGCLAESCRFDGVLCSDHLQPWAIVQGSSGHAWSWLGAALQATNYISFGTVTVPGGWRYHPVMMAQAIATLCEMFPQRMPWIAFGSGEALNEAVLGDRWPEKGERQRRMLEGVQLLRRLFQGESVSHFGALQALDARLWVKPPQFPRLFGAAMTEETARWAGGWADGLFTLGRDLDKLARVVKAFREGGGEGKPIHVKLDTCLGSSVDAALVEAHKEWRFACIGVEKHHRLRTPEAFEQASASITVQAMGRHVLAWSDPATLIDHVWACLQIGVEVVDFHHVGLDQARFIRAAAADVIPALRLKERRSAAQASWLAGRA
jgi:probable non-F420 flavinoid oxidoreductase